MEFCAARRGCGLTRPHPPNLPQSFATNIATFVANDVASSFGEIAGVNRKSYVTQTPLTVFPQNTAYNPTGVVGALAYWSAHAITTQYLKSPGPLVHA